MINSYKVFDFRGIPRFFDLDDDERSKIIDNSFEGIRLRAPKQSLPVTCNNEREVMICEQALRMLRGEASQYKRCDEWVDLTDDSNNPKSICINIVYRAKPKKELVVPWEYISDYINIIRVAKCGNVYGHKDDGDQYGTSTHIKLDIEGVELPVTVKRPE